MSDEIKAALTPGEWQTLIFWKRGKMTGGKVRGQVVLGLPNEQQHAAAACALYAEPFGFTQEDVRWLDIVIEEARSSGPAHLPFGALARLRSIRARVAALLPPVP